MSSLPLGPRLAACLAPLLISAPALAQETIDIGTIRNEDIAVVQKILYPKAGRFEIGVHVGIMPFDAYTTTPNAAVSFTQHLSERTAVSVVGGVGYGLKTGTYRELESPTFGVAPYAYRYLGSALAGLEWTPFYAKLNVNGRKVIHFDAYFTLRAGATLEDSVVPGANITVAPTLSPGGGGRLWLGKVGALKLEIRDDLLLQYRELTEDWHFKQNANVMLGLLLLSGARK